MALDQLLTRVNQLQEKLDQLSPLTEENKQSLWDKLCLDWNWNSSLLEGSTVTYKETQSLMEKGQAATGDRAQEEMMGHAAALQMVRDWARDKDWVLSENAICALNKTILVRPFIKELIGAEGVTTKREVKVGTYKEFSEPMELASAAIFRYAEPEEVPAKMQGLIEWYQEGTAELHPAVVAATLHYVIVSIHPFEEGNGRLASLLMNYHLMKARYLPLVIPYIDQKNYLAAIHRANEGDLNAFYEYIVRQLLNSQKLGLQAAKGELLVTEFAMETVVDYYLPILLKETAAQVAKAKDDSQESGYTLKASIYKTSKKYWVSIANLMGDTLPMEAEELRKNVEQIASQYRLKGKQQAAKLRVEWTYHLRGAKGEGQTEMPDCEEAYVVDFEKTQLEFQSPAGTQVLEYMKASQKEVIDFIGA